MRMPFGKHKDKLLSEVPRDYLEWLWKHVELREPLRGQIGWLLEESAERRPEPAEPKRKFDVDRWFRRLSVEFHPDRGGSKEAQQAIERGRKLLEDMLK